MMSSVLSEEGEGDVLRKPMFFLGTQVGRRGSDKTIFAWYHIETIYHALPYRHVHRPHITRATLAQVKRCALHL